MFWHDAYGLLIRSNLRIPRVPVATSASADAVPDLEIALAGDSPPDFSHVTMMPIYPPPHQWDAAILRAWRLSDGGLRLALYWQEDYFDWAINAGGSHYRAAWATATGFDDAIPYIIGLGMNAILRQRGILALHGAALKLPDQDRAIILMGDSGAGKSTTTLALLQAGCALVSDDTSAVAFGEIIRVQRGYAGLRLTPAATARFFGSVEALPGVWTGRFKNGFDERYLSLADAGFDFTDSSKPIAGIYLLAQRDPSLHQVRIEAVEGIEKVKLLSQHTHVPYALTAEGRWNELMQIKALAARIAVRRVLRPDDLERLPSVIDAILHDAHTTL